MCLVKWSWKSLGFIKSDWRYDGAQYYASISYIITTRLKAKRSSIQCVPEKTKRSKSIPGCMSSHTIYHKVTIMLSNDTLLKCHASLSSIVFTKFICYTGRLWPRGVLIIKPFWKKQHGFKLWFLFDKFGIQLFRTILCPSPFFTEFSLPRHARLRAFFNIAWSAQQISWILGHRRLVSC